MMESFNQYHPRDDVIQLECFIHYYSVSLILLFSWDVPHFWLEQEFAYQVHLMSMAIWHIACLLMGCALCLHVHNEDGHMIVRSHERRGRSHPSSCIKKFVFIVGHWFERHVLLSQQLVRLFLTGTNLLKLGPTLAGVFVRIGSIVPDIAELMRHPAGKPQRWGTSCRIRFHNQMMHNFCTVFLVIEILLTTPQLEFVYMLFGILIGLAYALFAFPFAAFGGGYYCYSFIDPRLQKAPLFITMLALAISLFYVGVWFVSELISLNFILGSISIIAWCSLIVQFKPNS